jgi:tetratricopeptide (TPR) repeat protein
MLTRVTRRRFLETAAAAGLVCPLLEHAAPTPFAAPAAYPVHFLKATPWDSLFPYIEPGQDEFIVEKQAAEITVHLNRLLDLRDLPLSPDFQGTSPMPVRHTQVADGVFRAEFNPADQGFRPGLQRWVRSLGQVRSARFFVLPQGRVRYEIASTAAEALHYRVGFWNQQWTDGRLSRFAPLEETWVTSPRPLFEDVTASLLGGVDSFVRQLRRGVPYWRAHLDSACGIDVYGNNGIAVGDIDGDGWDEVYVCQPAGLPNRLYKRREDGGMEDITERAGVGVLDDSTAALFADFRNSGHQDLIVLTIGGPLLFLNDGAAFRHKPEAFRFANAPQGTFTGMAAADYDRDGRLDLYLCTYIYFQSEDQYRYPAPYHDARNGPPNFLFRNQLTQDGGGVFEDVTAAAGMNENNDRYSFAPAWCDYDGDGWPDLYVANDFGRNNLYKNDRGRFHDVAAAAGVEDIGPGMSVTWFDYDGDGRPDLYVSNMWTASGQRVVEQMTGAGFQPSPGIEPAQLADAYRRHAKGNSLYRNRGDGTFDETEAAEGVEMGRWAWSSDAFDFDNDGSPEIYVTCGMLTNPSERDLMGFFWRQVVARSPATKTSASAYENGWNAIDQWMREDYSWNGREPNVFYARRRGRFYDFSGISGLDYADDSRAFAVTDFDGDGNLDLLLKSRLGPQVRALRNQWGASRKSLAIQLQGVESNRDAIGASVELEHAGGRVVGYLAAGSGYLSQHTKVLHFGLADSPVAERVRVRWPSGGIQEFENLAAGFRYRIAEGSRELKRQPFLRRQDTSMPPAAVVPDNQTPFEPTWLLEPVPLPGQHGGPGFVCLVAGEAPTQPRDVPFRVVDLAQEHPDLAAAYALFRRYLFDYRSGLTLPLLILVDERGLAHKVYPGVPDGVGLREDLKLLRDPDRARLALPFRGRYYAPPHRNYFRLGAAFYWAGYPEQALVYLNEVVRLDAGNAKTHLAIGNIHLEAGRHDLAREHLERAVLLLPESADAWNDLGSLEMAVKNYPAALRDFKMAIGIHPDSFSLVGAGQAYAALADVPAAEEMFRRALEKNERDAEAANQMGLLLSRQNRNDEARRYFERAIAAQRDHASAINNLGVLYMQMNKVDDALAAFRYGIEVAPDNETLYLNLARFYARSGDRAKARDILQQLRVRKPDSTLARKALQELAEQ